MGGVYFMDKEDKLVYVPMAVDTVHPGHLNIINKAAELGKVMVGLFTDEAIASYKKIPVMDYEQRKSVVESIKGVHQVVKQETRDYEPNLRKFKPDYMVHGTDWREGPLAAVREKAIAVMEEWNGKVVEPEYTEGISSSGLHKQMERQGVPFEQRQGKLKKALELKEFIRIIGIHDGLSGILAEKATLNQPGEPVIDFEALYIEAESCALSRGLENKVRIDFSEYFNIISEVMEVTTKPIIVRDNATDLMEFERSIKKYEKLGVSALVVHENVEKESTCEKLRMARNLRITDEFMIILEMDGESMDQGSFKNAGADAIMITGSLEMCEQLKTMCKDIPAIAAVTTDSKLKLNKFKVQGFKAMVYRDSILPGICHYIEDLLKDLIYIGELCDG